MPSVHETSYPRLKSSISAQDLADIYTPTEEEVSVARRAARGASAKLCFLVLLKTFQRLGYFTQLRDVPPTITEHISRCLRGEFVDVVPVAYDESGTRRRHVATIRKYMKVSTFDDSGHELLASVVCDAALTKEDLADIINVAIEELVRVRYELPGFTTIVKAARRGRAKVNRTLFRRVSSALGAEGALRLDRFFVADIDTERTPWNILREDSGPATLTHFRKLVRRLHWLTEQNFGRKALAAVPNVKIHRFAAEARSLDAARMQEMQAQKRHTLAVALISVQVARTLDDLGDMFLKRMRKIQRKGRDALDDYRRRQQGRTDELIAFLHDLVATIQTDATAEDRIAVMGEVLGGRSEEILEDCKAHAAYANDNYFSLLWRFYKSHRKTLFELVTELPLAATSQDTAVEQALGLLREHSASKKGWIDIDSQSPLDLSWVPDKWWKLVTCSSSRTKVPTRVDRRHFEVCLFSQLMIELKSGDLCIDGSDRFADYRDQLISWEEYDRTAASYGEQVGISAEPKDFVACLRTNFETLAAETDSRFPGNDSVRFENGEPVLRRFEKRSRTGELKELEQLITERIEPVNILDVLADTENWLGWTRFFGPISGHDAKVESSRDRYVATAFCYGCNLGPSQTARCLEGFDRRQIAWVNQRHVTDETLEEAITAIVNAYNRFALPRLWGSGKRVSADGTKWDLYEQNLLSEYHVRYGGYGGIGYYHVSDTYIALFSHFIPCGVWEAVYILDGLLKNMSDIQPDTVHSDTQGQSATVFGLAHLLGIDLMPRIRNWKDLTLFRPSRESRYDHIDSLFSDVADWRLIETHLPDMLRVGLSIRAGRITPSVILRKLGNYSRKNRLFQAFRELGRVIRSMFLLRYIGDLELRRTIQTATNKSESFNRFVQWLLFGGERLIAENDRDRQRKIIKYNHLVANCLIFHNVHAQTRILHDLINKEVRVFDDETLSRLSPYGTEHVNRFGTYDLDFDRNTAAPDYTLSTVPETLETS